MSIWRLLGNLPQAKTREGIRAQSLDGWNPWQHHWKQREEPDIVVPDPEDSKRFHHATTYWVDMMARCSISLPITLSPEYGDFLCPLRPQTKELLKQGFHGTKASGDLQYTPT